MICKLCDKEKKLIRAHIIPESFYSKGHKKLYADDLIYEKKMPKGLYDTEILCGECDNKIGKLDGLAKKILMDKKGVTSFVYHSNVNPEQFLNVFKLDNKSMYDSLNLFFISLGSVDISHRQPQKSTSHCHN